MMDPERDLRDMMQRTADGVRHVPQPSRGLVRRARLRRVRTAALAGTVVLALVVGGFAGARSLTSDEALPPADEDSKVSPFVDTWTTTDVDGRTRTMVIRAAGDDAYEITVQNHLALVCSGAPSTLTGTGQLIDSKLVFFPSPEITCDDGSQPKVEGFAESAGQLLSDLTFDYDPESDILINYSPLEDRRVAKDGQVIYNGLTLVWGRAESENRLGDVSGWITYGDERGIWARDLTSSDDPSDRVRLSSTPGTPIAWSPDGSKLLVVRDVPPPDSSVIFSTDLFIVNSDGTETRLTDANGSIEGGSFSPDGAEVVYAMGSAIHVVDAEGGTPRLVRSAGERLFEDSRCPQFKGCVGEERPVLTSLQAPTYSPDGTQIAYFDGIGDSGHSLRVMDNDGTDMRVVVENSETLGAGHVNGLQWSPDGSQLAFSIEDLYVVGVDGSAFRLVADDAVEPYWSPDGSHIAYARDPDESEGGSLEIVRLDDLQVQNFGDGESGPWTAEVGGRPQP
jgi:dipeptidyl aminopeptidase/acylaminoacyl peptidase